MSQESYADFSIVKRYMELKNKYNIEVEHFKNRTGDIQGKYQKKIESLENELTHKNNQGQMLETQIQELNEKIKEKDELLKNLGLQLHKVRTEQEQNHNQSGMEGEKKSKFGIFK
jgi:septal ring factor EnvC (AmiA/AmiB activator)